MGLRLCVLLSWLASGGMLAGELVPVRHVEGTAHAFLVLKNMAGAQLASGDLIQVVRDERVESELKFHFSDGSLFSETTIYSQHEHFRLVSSHLIQRGRSFPKAIDERVEASGQITSRTTESGKRSEVKQEHMDLPPDVANGMLLALVMNIRPETLSTEMSMVIPGGKPRLVKLEVQPNGEQPFSVGGDRRKAVDFLVKIKIGGISGMIAPFIGKQPADLHVWVLSGSAPAFVKEEGQLYEGGPLWRIEQVSPRL